MLIHGFWLVKARLLIAFGTAFYAITMIDYATRYPEAVALPCIETERVAETLVEMFSRVGIPDEMFTA